MDFPLMRADIIRPENLITKTNPDGSTYKFARYQFGELGTERTPELMDEITQGFQYYAPTFPDFDRLVTTAPGGHEWSVLAGMAINKGVRIAQNKTTFHSEEKVYPRPRAYDPGNLYFAGFVKGERVLIYDDIINGLGTIQTVLTALQDLQVIAVGILAFYARNEKYKTLAGPDLPVKVFLDKEIAYM